MNDRSKSIHRVSSDGNGFSAAEIVEPQPEDSGDDGDLKSAGERRAESAAAVARGIVLGGSNNTEIHWYTILVSEIQLT